MFCMEIHKSDFMSSIDEIYSGFHKLRFLKEIFYYTNFVRVGHNKNGIRRMSVELKICIHITSLNFLVNIY